MARVNNQGTIPLENMRLGAAYGEAKETKPDPPKVPPKHHDGVPKYTPSDDLIDFLEEDAELSDAEPPEKSIRKYSIPINAKDLIHEDDDDKPQSRASSPDRASIGAKSFETATFDQCDEFSSTAFGGNNATLIQELYAKISSLTRDRQIAEEKADRAAERVDEMKQLVNEGMSDISRDTRSLAEEIEKLRDEKRFLREQLEDAQSHIFSLQPYRKELTAEEVGREYDDLVEKVQDWVQKVMEPFLEDPEAGIDEIVTAARKRQMDSMLFKKAIKKNPDLIHATTFPETDEDVVVGIILRFLHDNIFQKIMYGSIQNYTEVISFIENFMQTAVEPKRDLFSIRNWTAEAYNSLLSAPAFRAVRTKRSREFTLELGTTLKIFCRKDRFQRFCEEIEENCIMPAMKFYEKLQVSTHHFYLDMNPFMAWGSGGEVLCSGEFIDNIEKLDCRNVLQNRKVFNMGKMDPKPTASELRHHMVNVCTVVPALMMRQVGQRDAIKEPVVVRRQQMLVAWGPEEKRRTFLEEGDVTLCGCLFGVKSDGGSWVSNLRW